MSKIDKKKKEKKGLPPFQTLPLKKRKKKNQKLSCVLYLTTKEKKQVKNIIH